MGKNTLKLYSIKGIDYDAVIKKYCELCRKGEESIDEDSISVYSNTEVKTKRTKEGREPLQDYYRILFKATYLVHTIAYRQITQMDNDSDGVSISTKILQGVLQSDYNILINALKELGYISVTSYYVIGVTCRKYRVLGDIIEYPVKYNKTIAKYQETTKNKLKKVLEEKISSKSFEDLYGSTFVETYIKNLNKFKIVDIEGFTNFSKRKRSSQKKIYYNYIKESFNKKLEINTIDRNYRFYTILTSLKRELKRFLNIKFQIDCKNSHPLLFNYILYQYKQLDTGISYKLSSILYNIQLSDIFNPSSNHYDIEKLCNILNSNGIENSILAKFENDELLYLWKTTTGRFWDDIVKEYEGKYPRWKVKQNLFKQVFYSRTESQGMFAQQFRRDYPNVYNIILEWKNPTKNKRGKEFLLKHNMASELNGIVHMTEKDKKGALPNLMMTLESSIFREILKSLYRKRIPAVHIHDAIVVPDTKTEVDINKIEEVMRNAYKKFGLHPTFAVDNYQK